MWPWTTRAAYIWPGWTPTTLPCPGVWKSNWPFWKAIRMWPFAAAGCNTFTSPRPWSVFPGRRRISARPRFSARPWSTGAVCCAWTRRAPTVCAMIRPWPAPRISPSGAICCWARASAPPICRKCCCTTAMCAAPLYRAGMCGLCWGTSFPIWAWRPTSLRPPCMRAWSTPRLKRIAPARAQCVLSGA